MRDFPKGGMIGKMIRVFRKIASLQVSLYAANASFFLLLSAFPLLVLLLGLLRFTPLAVERLGELLAATLPQALAPGAEELILTTYDNSSGLVLTLSGLVTLWSASRGLQSLRTGLNRIYGVREHRGWLRRRLLSMGYTIAFLLVLLLTLGLHMFAEKLLTLLSHSDHIFLRLLVRAMDLRFFLLLGLQSGIFTAMFMVLPGSRNSFWESFPGALLAASVWQLFSDLYSVYAERFVSLQNIYGSVYTVALTMLWLYGCIAILFYAGAMNVFLAEK